MQVDVRYRCTVPESADEHTTEVLTELRQRRWARVVSDYDYDVDEFRCDGRRHRLTHRFESETMKKFRPGRANLTVSTTVCWEEFDAGAEGCVATSSRSTVWIRKPRVA